MAFEVPESSATVLQERINHDKEKVEEISNELRIENDNVVKVVRVSQLKVGKSRSGLINLIP